MIRGRSGVVPGAGTIIDYNVSAPLLAFGSLPGKLFIPSGATYGTARGVFIYMPSVTGTGNNVFQGVTTLGLYCAAHPTNVPFYIYSPQLPAGANYKDVWDAIKRGLAGLFSTYRINMRKITTGGYSAGASYMCRTLYSDAWLLAGYCPQDGNINRQNLCVTTPSINGEGPASTPPWTTVMNPADAPDTGNTALNNIECFDVYARRLIAAGTKVMMCMGDLTSDAVNDMTGLGTALQNNGAVVQATHTATFNVNDSYVMNIFDGKDHPGMETEPFSNTNAVATIAWIDNCTRPAAPPQKQPY